MRRRHLATVAATALTLLCLIVSGCSGKTYAEEQRERIETATLRTDPEPIIKRWPPLGDIQQVHWVAGSLTDDRGVPGPSRYFLEVVVVLSPADIARLTSQYPLGPAPNQPDPPAALQPFVRAGTWLNSKNGLDQALSDSSDSYAEVYVQPETATVYISSREG